jgi:hypothetical protein
MGYNIDISFDIYKNCSITELKDDLIELAQNSNCDPFYYINYEMENGFELNQKRHHCVVTFNFDNSNIMNFIKFVNKMKNQKPFHIETIYDDSKIIYASKYYKRIISNQQIKQNDNPNLNNKQLRSLFNSTDNLILLNINKK